MEKCPYTFPNDGRHYAEQWTCEDVLHRDPLQGPAYIEALGNEITATYYWNGHYHRLDGPALIKWDRATGRCLQENYFFHGQRHRDPAQGPQETTLFRDGGSRESYAFAGQPYRDPSEGPHEIWRNIRGEVTSTKFSSPEDLTEQTKALEKLVRLRSILPKPRFP